MPKPVWIWSSLCCCWLDWASVLDKHRYRSQTLHPKLSRQTLSLGQSLQHHIRSVILAYSYVHTTPQVQYMVQGMWDPVIKQDGAYLVRLSVSRLKPEDRTLEIGVTVVKPTDIIRNLGVLFDSELTMKRHVSKTVSTCFYHLRRLRQLRRHVDFDTIKQLVFAFIFSRLDYCIAVLYGQPQSTIGPLQRVQNALLGSQLVYHRAIMSVRRWRSCTGC